MGKTPVQTRPVTTNNQGDNVQKQPKDKFIHVRVDSATYDEIIKASEKWGGVSNFIRRVIDLMLGKQ